MRRLHIYIIHKLYNDILYNITYTVISAKNAYTCLYILYMLCVYIYTHAYKFTIYKCKYVCTGIVSGEPGEACKSGCTAFWSNRKWRAFLRVVLFAVQEYVNHFYHCLSSIPVLNPSNVILELLKKEYKMKISTYQPRNDSHRYYLSLSLQHNDSATVFVIVNIIISTGITITITIASSSSS